MNQIRSLVFYLALGVATFALVPMLFISLFLRGLTATIFLTRWSVFIVHMLKAICGVDYEILGMENIPAGNTIIMSKHQSAWETFALQIPFPAQTWVLKRELLWIPIFGWTLARGGAIAIDRKSGKKALNQVIQKGRDRLEKGYYVVVFPEGTRIKPGEKGKYNIGGAMLASRTGYPVVPVAHNAGLYWPGHGFTIKPGKVKMVIGPMLDTEGMKAGDINAHVEEWIEGQMKELTP
jgi:1-acyl-sn-glycerol-3-phosphate acyltransferase